MMRATTVTILARVGDSDVLNEIGTIDVNLVMEPITDETRLPGDAPGAQFRTEDFDLAGGLRRIADQLEGTD